MTVMAAVALGGLFAGCTKEMESVEGNTAQLNVMKVYEEAFITRFGQPAATQTWGFAPASAATRSMTRGVYADGNMWASEEGGNWKVPTQLTAEQKDLVRQYFQQNDKLGYDDPKWTDYFIQQVYKGHTNTEDSKSAEEYTSANDGLVVGSDHMDHLAACNSDGSIKDHIYNYNFGTCSTYPDILNTEGVTYYNPNGNYHSDAIQLMVGSTTAKFGYFNSDGSLGHTEYTGLVGWETIRTWARDKGIYTEDILNDGWNRSFMGFDFEQVVGDDVYVHTDVEIKDENGVGTGKYEVRYATYNDCPSFDYVWDGEKAIKFDASAQTVTTVTDITSRLYVWDKNVESYVDKVYTAKQWGGLAVWKGDADWSSYTKLVIEFSSGTPVSSKLEFGVKEYEQWINVGTTKVECDFINKDMSLISQIALQSSEAATFNISKVYLVGNTTPVNKDDQILVDGKPIPMLVEKTNQYCGINGDIDQNSYRTNRPVLLESGQTQDWGCLDLSIIQDKVRNGYTPVINSTMCKWVKVQGGADGYFSDWIVTLTKAEKNDDDDEEEDEEEDEEDDEDDDDDEFVCRVIAEDLTVSQNTDFDFNDVVFDVYKSGLIRIRACGGTLPLRVDGQEIHGLFGKETGVIINTGWDGDIDYYNTYKEINYSKGTVADAAAANLIPVEVYKQGQWMPLEAPEGDVASKIAVDIDYEWCKERQDIDDKWHLSQDGYKPFSDYVQGKIIGNAWYQMVIEKSAEYRNKKNKTGQ